MRRMVLALFGLLLLAVPASAEKLAYEGFLQLQFANLGRAKANDTGTGIATVNGSAGLGHLTTLQINEQFAALNDVLPVTDPIVTAGGIVVVQLTDVGNAASQQGGVLRPISGAIQSTMALSVNTVPSQGFVKICLYDPGCGAALDLQVGATKNGVFFGAGVGGVLTIGGAGGIRISILGAPWTVKTVSVSNRTNGAGITTFQRFGYAHGPASGTSSTALTSGVIQFVSANQTRTQGIPGNSDAQGQVTTNRFHFIPEPGLLLLLGSGAVGLAVLGRRRMK